MKQSIHLLDPVNGHLLGKQFPTMRCGRTQNFNSAQPLHTTKTTEVTCTNCQSYINNPWRVMRKYGRVKVVESFFVVLWADYGFKLDMVATIIEPGSWMVLLSYCKRIYSTRIVTTGNMANLGFQLLAIYEKEIIEIEKSSVQNQQQTIVTL